MRKPESSRLNVVYILQVLSAYSDEEHPMTVSQIKKKLDEEFGYLSDTEQLISADTIKRTLEEMMEKLFPENMSLEDRKLSFGYSLHCVMHQEGTFVTYRAKEGKQPPVKYYYYEGILTLPELVTLKDAVETYSYFSQEDITDLIRKIIRMKPCSFPRSKYYDAAGVQRDENSLLFMNIDDLYRIIRKRKGARITYCYYDRNKQLVPRPGYPKVVEPLHLMWSNGYYYLLAYNEKYKNIVNMRMDRITEIEEAELADSHRIEQFNPVAYRHEHPVMFGGEKETVVLLCRDTGKNYIMNTIMDVFGKDARVSLASDELVERYLKGVWEKADGQKTTWLKVTVTSVVGGVELWATQYCNDCVVISPEGLREQVRQRLLQGNLYYS